MYQLYYYPGACSMAVHVLFNEMDVPVELKKIDIMTDNRHKPEEFMKLNPRGQVPVLIDDGEVIRECAVIMIYLIEKHNSPLLLDNIKDRMKALEWLMSTNSTLHPAYARMFFLMKSATDKTEQEKLFKVALAMINKLWAEIEAKLENGPYICGENITAADILMTVISGWGAYFPQAPTLGPNVKRLIKEVSSRPSFQKALTVEKVEFKAAA